MPLTPEQRAENVKRAQEAQRTALDEKFGKSLKMSMDKVKTSSSSSKKRKSSSTAGPSSESPSKQQKPSFPPSNCDMLAYLLAPITPDVFFSEYFEKKPLVINRNKPNYYSGFFTRKGMCYSVYAGLVCIKLSILCRCEQPFATARTLRAPPCEHLQVRRR